LNEFLHGVSKGFQDAAFASFSRRRSTIREDIAQSFADTSSAAAATPAPASQTPAQAYLDMLNTDEGSTALVPAKSGRGRGRAASAKPKRGGGGGRGRGRSGGGRGGIRQI